ARDGRRLGPLLGNASTLGAIAAALSTVAMAALAWRFGYDDATARAIAVLAVALVPWTVGSLLEAGFVATERMDHLAWTALAESVLKVGLGVAALVAGLGVDAVLGAAVVARVAAVVVALGLLRREGVRVVPSLDRHVQRALLRVTPTFLLVGIFATLYWRIDVFMLSKMRPVEDVGYYGAAWRLLELAMVVPQSLCLSLYPQLVAALREDRERVARLGALASRWLLAVALPAAVVCTVLARPILRLFYGSGFDPAVPSLVVLMWTLVPYGIVRYHAYLLVGADHQRVDLWMNVAMTVVNVLLNLVLIPAMGPVGAAIATLVSVLVYAISQVGFLARRLPGTAAPLGLAAWPIVASVAAGAIAWLLRDAPVVVPATVAAAAYVAILVAGGFVGADELDSLGLGALAGLVRRTGRTA
ncbi:MAG: flippase, partial [Alphaproteobacteria bacterium]